jgi:hypothetical protein
VTNTGFRHILAVMDEVRARAGDIFTQAGAGGDVNTIAPGASVALYLVV